MCLLEAAKAETTLKRRTLAARNLHNFSCRNVISIRAMVLRNIEYTVKQIDNNLLVNQKRISRPAIMKLILTVILITDDPT